jgi:excinuclease ABC subunit C
LSKLLKIKKPIVRIEGYDVSNIQGTHATGSMVTFVNGIPDKNFYRKFKIRNPQSVISGGNDTAMLREILERRLNHPEWPFPDLIVIDGGKGQVSSALAILKKMNISLPVIGLSKNEKHVGHQLIIPGHKQPIPLTKLGLTDKNLLLTIDSEAHRFAIGHYRQLHRKLFT